MTGAWANERVPINKPWQRFDPAQAKAVPATVGVYELADGEGRTIFIGCAGAKEPFGLRGCLSRHFSSDEPNPVLRDRARLFRYEVTQQYLSRYRELLILHREEFGQLPTGQPAASLQPGRLGRFHYQPSTGQWQP